MSWRQTTAVFRQFQQKTNIFSIEPTDRYSNSLTSEEIEFFLNLNNGYFHSTPKVRTGFFHELYQWFFHSRQQQQNGPTDRIEPRCLIIRTPLSMAMFEKLSAVIKKVLELFNNINREGI